MENINKSNITTESLETINLETLNNNLTTPIMAENIETNYNEKISPDDDIDKLSANDNSEDLENIISLDDNIESTSANDNSEDLENIVNSCKEQQSLTIVQSVNETEIKDNIVIQKQTSKKVKKTKKQNIDRDSLLDNSIKIDDVMLINVGKQNKKLIKKMKHGFNFNLTSEKNVHYTHKDPKAVIDISKDLDESWAKIIKMILDGKPNNDIPVTDYFDFIESFIEMGDLKDTKIHVLVKLLTDQKFIDQLDVDKLHSDFFNPELKKATVNDLLITEQIDEVDCKSESTATTVIANKKLTTRMEDFKDDDKYNYAQTSNTESDEPDKDYGIVEWQGKTQKYSNLRANEKRQYRDMLNKKYAQEHRDKLDKEHKVILADTAKINNQKADTTVEKRTVKSEKKKITYTLAAIDVIKTSSKKSAVNVLTTCDTTKDEIDSIKKVDTLKIDAVLHDEKIIEKPVICTGFSLLDVDVDQITDLDSWKYKAPQKITSEQRKKNQKMKKLTEISKQLRSAIDTGKMIDASDFRRQLRKDTNEPKQQQQMVDLLTAPNSLSLSGFPELMNEARSTLSKSDLESFNLWQKLKITDSDNKTFDDYISQKTNEDRTSQRVDNALKLCTVMRKGPYHPYIDDSTEFKKLYYVMNQPCVNQDHSSSKLSYIIDNGLDAFNKKVSLLWSFRYGCKTGCEPENSILPPMEASIYLIPYFKVDGIANSLTSKYPSKIPVMILNNYLAFLLTGNFTQTLVILSPVVKGAQKPFNFFAYDVIHCESLANIENGPFKALCISAGGALSKYLKAENKLNPELMSNLQETFFEICDIQKEHLAADVNMLKTIGMTSNKLRLTLHKTKPTLKTDFDVKITKLVRNSIAKVLPGDDIEEKRQRAETIMPNFIRLTERQKEQFVDCITTCVKNTKLGNTHYNHCIPDVDATTGKYITGCCMKGETIDDPDLYIAHPCVYHMLADGSGRHRTKDNASEIKSCGSCHARYNSVIISSLCYIAGLLEKSLKRDHFDKKKQKEYGRAATLIEQAMNSEDDE